MMDILDSTIIMIIGSYKGNKFFRCSYLIRQFYPDPEMQENQPEVIQLDKLNREIKVEKPIIQLYELVWEETGNFGTEKLSGENFQNIDMFADTTTGDVDDRANILNKLKANNTDSVE